MDLPLLAYNFDDRTHNAISNSGSFAPSIAADFAGFSDLFFDVAMLMNPRNIPRNVENIPIIKQLCLQVYQKVAVRLNKLREFHWGGPAMRRLDEALQRLKGMLATYYKQLVGLQVAIYNQQHALQKNVIRALKKRWVAEAKAMRSKTLHLKKQMDNVPGMKKTMFASLVRQHMSSGR